MAEGQKSPPKTGNEKQLCKREDFTGSLVKMTPKEMRLLKRPPRVFSEQFEAYVARETERCANATSEEKFQIHREVFQYTIEQFGEHRQVLCDIKMQYDNAVKRRDETIHQLQETNRHLVTEAELHARRLKSAQVTAQKEVETLKLTQAQMRHQMALLTDQKQKIAKELEEVREALFVERRRYREEHEAHQMAQSDLTELTQRYDNLLKRLNSRPPPSDTKATSNADDPIVLRVALNKCREELSAVSARLVVMETSYTEVVPLRELKLARAETEQVRAEGEERLAALQQVLQQERETEVFRTPRPDWNRAAAYVPGGETEWGPLRASLPSCDVMQVLLDQLSAPGPDTFTGLGTESELIPPFLKWQGEVRNLRITRRQVVHIICDIMECKENNEDPFQSFFILYFKERFPFSWTEWIYSFHYALERLTADDPQHLLLGLVDGAGTGPHTDTGTPAEEPVGAPPPPQPAQPPPPPPPPRPQPGSGAPRPSVAVAQGRPSIPAGGAGSLADKLQQMLEQRQARLSVSSGPSERSAGTPATAPPSGQTQVDSSGADTRGASAPAAQPPVPPEQQNRRIQLFWNILYGKQHESVYTRNRNALLQLRKEFSVADADKQGTVLYDSLGRIISEAYFSIKTDEEIQRLVLAAAFGRTELEPGHVPPVTNVNYARFLDMCRETDSAFLQEFYQQMDRASAVYIDQLTELLNDGDVIQKSILTQAVTTLTPDIADAELQRICAWVCPADGQALSLEECIDRLKGLPLPPERTAAAGDDAV
ncbi:uncharacterized protein LOC122387877 [Amphibalanus amphitrite]|uniref:uncharacterized protein LOC122387877 n=1 Tax=Amphibalanus amphitrite TaxID=1232801 RepID=UPI001C921190|nr:uncharacterized protein LOC122387877 [Amphibalanus amphitrite]